MAVKDLKFSDASLLIASELDMKVSDACLLIASELDMTVDRESS